MLFCPRSSQTFSPSNVSRSDETSALKQHWRWCDEWKGILPSLREEFFECKIFFFIWIFFFWNFFLFLANSSMSIKHCSAENNRKRFSALFSLRSFDLLLLLCQFWRLFSRSEKTKKNANLRREETLISCFDGYTKEFDSAMWKLLHTVAEQLPSWCAWTETSRLARWISSTSLKRFAIAIDVQQCQATTKIEFERSLNAHAWETRKESFRCRHFLTSGGVQQESLELPLDSTFPRIAFDHKLQLFSEPGVGGRKSIFRVWI